MKTNEKNVSGQDRRLNRRSFMGTSAAAAAVFTVVPGCVLGRSGHPAPSQKINLAFIGVGDKGVGNLNRLLNLDDVEVVAVCDVDKRIDYNRQEFSIVGLDQALAL